MVRWGGGSLICADAAFAETKMPDMLLLDLLPAEPALWGVKGHQETHGSRLMQKGCRSF